MPGAEARVFVRTAMTLTLRVRKGCLDACTVPKTVLQSTARI
jgi:hypothetical protein